MRWRCSIFNWQLESQVSGTKEGEEMERRGGCWFWNDEEEEGKMKKRGWAHALYKMVKVGPAA